MVSLTDLELVCERLVPGSRAAGSARYAERLLADLPEETRVAADAAVTRLAAAAAAGDDEAAFGRAGTDLGDSFGLLRACAVEAYYSGYRAPGAPGPDGWQAIGFSTPQTDRLKRDYGYVMRGQE
jgi:hypothetical protein